ncbi:hypothetical protein J2X72_004361 [Phyllobacterium sp. 1468]|nr:hypothetical protein [Phyllobacterium sp. 1468]
MTGFLQTRALPGYGKAATDTEKTGAVRIPIGSASFGDNFAWIAIPEKVV